jgi:hypothetical protein
MQAQYQTPSSLDAIAAEWDELKQVAAAGPLDLFPVIPCSRPG